MTITRTVGLSILASVALAAQERGGRGFGPPNLLWTTLDVDHDNIVSAAELVAPRQSCERSTRITTAS